MDNKTNSKNWEHVNERKCTDWAVISVQSVFERRWRWINIYLQLCLRSCVEEIWVARTEISDWLLKKIVKLSERLLSEIIKVHSLPEPVDITTTSNSAYQLNRQLPSCSKTDTSGSQHQWLGGFLLQRNLCQWIEEIGKGGTLNLLGDEDLLLRMCRVEDRARKREVSVVQLPAAWQEALH